MGEKEPKLKAIWSLNNMPENKETIHSAIRYMDRFLFLVDSTNFYKIDMETSEIKTY